MADNTNIRDDLAADDRETPEERAARLDQERLMLDEARADVRAGRVIADADLDRWLDRFVRGEALFRPDGSPFTGGER